MDSRETIAQLAAAVIKAVDKSADGQYYTAHGPNWMVRSERTPGSFHGKFIRVHGSMMGRVISPPPGPVSGRVIVASNAVTYLESLSADLIAAGFKVVSGRNRLLVSRL